MAFIMPPPGPQDSTQAAECSPESDKCNFNSKHDTESVHFLIQFSTFSFKVARSHSMYTITTYIIANKTRQGNNFQAKFKLK